MTDQYTQCIHTLFEAQAERTPDAVAVVYDGRATNDERRTTNDESGTRGACPAPTRYLTYAELNRRANQLAHHLQTLGVRPGTQVGICIERSLELVIGILGILKAGAAYVPLDPAYPAERLRFMLDDAKVRVLITTTNSNDKVTRRQGDKELDVVSDVTLSPGHLVTWSQRTVDLRADWERIAHANPANPAGSATADDLLYVIYTSGSTGRPKGAGVYHRGFANLLHWFIAEFEIDFHDRVLLISSFSFDLTQKNIFTPLITGGSLYLFGSEHYDIAAILQTIFDNAITLLNCTPSAFYPLIEQFDQQIAAKLASLRYVFLGGEPIAVSRMRDWITSEQCKATVVNTYGPTECTDIVAFYRLDEPEQFLEASIPIGKPIFGTQLYIVDEELQLSPAGAAGELCVAGNGVGCGYLNDSERTALKFVPNPFGQGSGVRGQGSGRTERSSDPRPLTPDPRLYRTGDLVRRLPDGNIAFLGRIDEQVKLHGFRIEPGEIEAVLSRHPAVKECVVVVREDGPGEKRLAAYVVTAEGTGDRGQETDERRTTNDERPAIDERRTTNDEGPAIEDRRLKLEDSDASGSAPLSPILHPLSSDLRRFLADRLPTYMLPSIFVFLAALPLTANGKVDRRRLSMPGQDQPDVNQGFVAPRTCLERMLAAIWQDLLGLEAVGVHDSFFELGGNSIQAALFANRLQALLGEVVYVVTVFDAPTIAELTVYLPEQYPAAIARLCGAEAVVQGPAAPAHHEPIGAADIAAFRAAIAPLPPYPARAVDAPNPPAIFVLSPPRSGSTLLRVMLAGHSRLFAPPELELLSFNTLLERKTAFAGRDRFWLEGTIRAIMAIKGCDAGTAEQLMAACERQAITVRQFYRQLQAWLGERTLVDKTPAYALDPAILARMERDFDQARYIHLLRHPYAMIRSFEEAKLNQVFFRHRHSFTTRQLAELIWLVSHQNILAFLEAIPAERRHTVRFEDLVARPRPTLEGICAFLGLELQPAMLEPYQAPQERMTDGIHALSKMLGDVKFLTYRGIDATVGERWKQQPASDPLGAITWQVAEALGYPREILETTGGITT